MEPSSTADVESKGRIPSLIDDYVSDLVPGNSGANGLNKDDSSPSTTTSSAASAIDVEPDSSNSEIKPMKKMVQTEINFGCGSLSRKAY